MNKTIVVIYNPEDIAINYSDNLIDSMKDMFYIPDEYSYDPCVFVLPIPKNEIKDHKYDDLKADCVIYKGEFLDESIIDRAFEIADEVRTEIGYTAGLDKYVFEYYRDSYIADLNHTYKVIIKENSIK